MDLPKEPATEIDESMTTSAAERLLRSWRRHDVEYVFSNLGTDHTPIIEAMARLRSRGEDDSMPEVVVCPHEFVAMSAAHGHAAVSGNPQVVLVHVDVGTQNLGAAMHNAHRANVPVFVVSGLAPVSDHQYLGSRNHFVHYFQDVFDQTGIVREYCRWAGEYKPPADPASLVDRGMERARAYPQGPVYLTATREALEARFSEEEVNNERKITPTDPPGPSGESLETLTELLDSADAPVVITSGIRKAEALVEFAETTGAGVVEHAPTRASFPRDHPLHLGFDPSEVFDRADLVLLASAEVPWIPTRGEPKSDTPVVQIDPEPTKAAFPAWDFQIDRRIAADPALTLIRLTEIIDPEDDPHTAFEDLVEERRAKAVATLEHHRDEGALTPEVLSDALNRVVDDSTIIVEDAVTSMDAIQKHLDVPLGEGHLSKGGAGLGWPGGAAVGAKLANPDARVISLIGDGAYLFAHPSVSAWVSDSANAPTLTVIYNNNGWNAVEKATLSQYPDGMVKNEGLKERNFDPAPDLTAPATVVDAHTETVSDERELEKALDTAIEAIESGRPAVLDVQMDSRP